jgi:hypothetical protein
LPPIFSAPTAKLGENGVSIDVGRLYAIDYRIPPAAQLADRLKFNVHYTHSTMVFTLLNLVSRDKSQRKGPLDSLHPHAREAAEASHCAIEQGRFWEFHDRLFKNDPDSSRDTLDRFAKEIGMDVGAFEACRSSGKYESSVKASAQEGIQLGITGTPTFFINGRILVGAQPADAFMRIIDEEIAAAAAPVGEQRIAYPPSLKAEQPQRGHARHRARGNRSRRLDSENGRGH